MKPKQQNKQKDILFILISSFVVVVAWIAFNIIHIYYSSTVSPEVQSQLTPIDPNFDSITMQQLKTREVINPSFGRQENASQSAPTPPTIQTPGQPKQTPDITTITPTVPVPANTISQTPSPSITSPSVPSGNIINRQGQ